MTVGSAIPTEVSVPWLGRTVAVHWANHALLMLITWFVLVPIGVLAVRFFKPAPTPYGIERGTGRFHPKLLWWTMHYSILYLAIALTLFGAVISIYVSHGFSGSAHAFCGLATVLSGSLQIVSAWLRGTHGGKHGVSSDPEDPATWRGGHYDMTPRRRWFEAYHKTAGYFTIALACSAAGSGLMRYGIPSFAALLGTAIGLILPICVVLEGRGFRQDTYGAVYGNHPDHPYNRARSGI